MYSIHQILIKGLTIINSFCNLNVSINFNLKNFKLYFIKILSTICITFKESGGGHNQIED